MTITVTVTTPDNKSAKVSISNGNEQTLSPGQTVPFHIYDDVTVTISEVADDIGDNDGGVATTQGGGNGTPPPTHG